MVVLVRSVESYERVGEFVREAFDLFKPRFNETLLIKPNFLKFDNPVNGCITHPDVVKAVVDVLKEEGYNPVIAEGGFYRDSADECFNAFNLREIAECRNINLEERVEVRVDGRALKVVEAGKSILDAISNPFVSLPKLKVHTLAKATVTIKNNMGFLKKPAMFMHFRIHQKLVDLLHLLNPSFIIVDGVIGGAGSEMSTKPVRHGVMIAGNNAIEVDAVSAFLMGFDPESIGYIKKASEEFGVRLDSIDVKGDDMEKLRIDYSRNLTGRILGSINW